MTSAEVFKTIIVAGCARSGMTLTMNLLHYGGYPCFGPPPAFEEYEVGRIDWNEANGKAVKLVDTHIQFPPTGEYLVILTKRDIKEQTRSTIKFMRMVAGVKMPKDSPKLAKSIVDDWYKIKKWAERQSKMIIVDFADTLRDPEGTVRQINELIGFELKPEAVNCVIKRGPECYNEMLEAKLISDYMKNHPIATNQP